MMQSKVEDDQVDIKTELEKGIPSTPQLTRFLCSMNNAAIQAQIAQFFKKLASQAQDSSKTSEEVSGQVTEEEPVPSFDEKEIVVTLRTKDGLKKDMKLPNTIKCEFLISEISKSIKHTKDANISLFCKGERLRAEKALGEYSGTADEMLIFALVHHITQEVRQSAYLHQENQVSDEFLMIVMSASQLKPDAASIVEELCSIIDVKLPPSVILEKTDQQQEESKEQAEVKSEKFKGDNPVQQIHQIFQIFKDDLFRACIFAYTTPIFYSKLNQTLATQKYTKVPNYLAAIIQQLPKHRKIALKDSSRALYRGIPAHYVSLDTYKNYEHYYWTSFTSTSRNRKVAEVFAGKGGIIFKIFVGQNKPYTNIILPKSWSNSPEEEEVLLFPNFCFAVISKKKTADGFTEVMIAQVPFQNYLDYNQFNYPRIVWLDLNVFNKINSYLQKDLKKQFINIVFTKHEHKAIKELTTCKDSLLIISGSLGQTFVPKVHHLETMKGVAIYCLRTTFHKKWSKDYKKVGVVTSSVSRVVDWMIKKQASLAKIAEDQKENEEEDTKKETN